MKTLNISENICLVESKSVEFTKREKKQTAKVRNSLLINLTCLFRPLVKRCIVWLTHYDKYDFCFDSSLSWFTCIIENTISILLHSFQRTVPYFNVKSAYRIKLKQSGKKKSGCFQNKDDIKIYQKNWYKPIFWIQNWCLIFFFNQIKNCIKFILSRNLN